MKELVDNLGQRATFITDYITPITPTSERTCLGIVAINQKALAEAIRKSMATDPNVRHRQFQGFDIWEMTEDSVNPPEVEIEDPSRSRQPVRATISAAERDQNPEGEGQEQRYFPKSAVTVGRGFLFIASHVNFLEKILAQDANTSLASSGDYQAISKEMQALGANQVSFEVFVRQALAVHPTYELIRMNKLPEAQTMLAKMINRVLTKQGEQSRSAELDGSKLPPFEKVQQYFGLGGMFVATEPTGWVAVGFSPKEAQAQVGARQPAVRQQ